MEASKVMVIPQIIQVMDDHLGIAHDLRNQHKEYS